MKNGYEEKNWMHLRRLHSISRKIPSHDQRLQSAVCPTIGQCSNALPGERPAQFRVHGVRSGQLYRPIPGVFSPETKKMVVHERRKQRPAV